MSIKPTCYIQWVRRGSTEPVMVLQQWWTNWAERELNTPPEKCLTGGKWIDVPVVEPVREKPVVRTAPTDDDL